MEWEFLGPVGPRNFEHFRCISTVAREQLSVENLLHKMEVALDFLPAGCYAAIDVTHSEKITNVHSTPDRLSERGVNDIVFHKRSQMCI